MVETATAIATTAAATHDAPMPRLRSQSIDARSVAVLGAARPNAASPERPVATAASDGIVAVPAARVLGRFFARGLLAGGCSCARTASVAPIGVIGAAAAACWPSRGVWASASCVVSMGSTTTVDCVCHAGVEG